MGDVQEEEVLMIIYSIKINHDQSLSSVVPLSFKS